jgi:hypothetical protein
VLLSIGLKSFRMMLVALFLQGNRRGRIQSWLMGGRIARLMSGKRQQLRCGGIQLARIYKVVAFLARSKTGAQQLHQLAITVTVRAARFVQQLQVVSASTTRFGLRMMLAVSCQLAKHIEPSQGQTHGCIALTRPLWRQTRSLPAIACLARYSKEVKLWR